MVDKVFAGLQGRRQVVNFDGEKNRERRRRVGYLNFLLKGKQWKKMCEASVRARICQLTSAVEEKKTSPLASRKKFAKEICRKKEAADQNA